MTSPDDTVFNSQRGFHVAGPAGAPRDVNVRRQNGQRRATLRRLDRGRSVTFTLARRVHSEWGHAEVGALFRDGNQLGMRFVYVPDPPDVYGDETPKMAFGPVLSWAYSVRGARSFDLYPAIGLGAVFGQSPTTDMNKVLPYVQGGLGLRLRIPTANEGAVTLGPEIGFLPTITAPYMAFNVGMIGPRPKAM